MHDSFNKSPVADRRWGQFREKAYQLWTPEGYLIILPDEAVEDLKDVDDSFADNTALAKV